MPSEQLATFAHYPSAEQLTHTQFLYLSLCPSACWHAFDLTIYFRHENGSAGPGNETACHVTTGAGGDCETGNDFLMMNWSTAADATCRQTTPDARIRTRTYFTVTVRHQTMLSYHT